MEWLVLLVAPPPWHPKLDLMAEMVCPSEQSLAVKQEKIQRWIHGAFLEFSFWNQVLWVSPLLHLVFVELSTKKKSTALHRSETWPTHSRHRISCTTWTGNDAFSKASKKGSQTAQNQSKINPSHSLSLICCCLAKDAHCVQTFKASAASVYSKTPAMHSCTPLVRHVSNSDAQRFFSKNHLRFCRKKQQIPTNNRNRIKKWRPPWIITKHDSIW